MTKPIITINELDAERLMRYWNNRPLPTPTSPPR